MTSWKRHFMCTKIIYEKHSKIKDLDIEKYYLLHMLFDLKESKFYVDLSCCKKIF